MLCTMNNIICFHLFQAHMPPTYWVVHLLNILPIKFIPLKLIFVFLSVYVFLILLTHTNYHLAVPHAFSLVTQIIIADIIGSIYPPAKLLFHVMLYLMNLPFHFEMSLPMNHHITNSQMTPMTPPLYAILPKIAISHKNTLPLGSYTILGSNSQPIVR